MSKPSDKKPGQVIDGETGKVDRPPRRIDLSTLRDVRLEMAAVYRLVDAETMPVAEGTRRVYMLAEIAKVITIAEIEPRLDKLEGKLEQQQKFPGTELTTYAH